MTPALSHAVLLAIVAGSILLMLLRPRDTPEVYWVGGGSLLLIALRLIPVSTAMHAVLKGTDVYLFLIGMMLLSALASENGVFDWLSLQAIRGSKGSCSRLFALIFGIGTLVTIFMSNDATAVVLTPAILAAVQRAKVDARPHLFACALIANAASFVLPMSNPANLVVFQQGMPALGEWLLIFGVPSALAIAGTFAVLRLWFRKDMGEAVQMTSDAEALSSEGKVVVAGLCLVIVVLLVASQMKRELGMPACVAAMAVAIVVCARKKSSPTTLVKQISWATLLLVAALFVMVEAVQSVGALHVTEAWLAAALKLPLAAAAMVVGFVVAIGNNVVNNLPLGLLAGATLHAAQCPALVTHAALIGVDLGPNLSITGSLATILWLLAVRKEKLVVSFVDFLKVGAVAMPLALVLALAGAVAMHAAGLTK